jgi:hypothetical protein
MTCPVSGMIPWCFRDFTSGGRRLRWHYNTDPRDVRPLRRVSGERRHEKAKGEGEEQPKGAARPGRLPSSRPMGAWVAHAEKMTTSVEGFRDAVNASGAHGFGAPSGRPGRGDPCEPCYVAAADSHGGVGLNGMKLRQSVWQYSYRFKYSHCKTLAISGQYGLNFMPFDAEPGCCGELCWRLHRRAHPLSRRES